MSLSGGVVLMSCVREGSLEPPYRPPHTDTNNHGEGRTNRFFRGLRRMFKRRSGARASSPDHKSSSTSELLDAERHAARKEGAYGSGLSVSHDSVFTGERSGDESSDERPTPAHGLAHVATSHRAELVAAVRRRGRGDGSDDDEDLGLPRSPPASPPTDKADKRHHAGISQSSCSDGSLLSVGSSEMDEDSSSGHHHAHDHSNRSDHSDLYNSSEPPTGVAPLSHSAAKHKMAVRPRRTHGAPRRKKIPAAIAATTLPITPELNEEMIRSTTPEVTHKLTEVVTESFSSSTSTKRIVKEQQHQLNKELHKVLEPPCDAKLKSSSLPPGLALSQIAGQSPAKLTIAECNTPRSSIKRSKSSSQGQSAREDIPKTQASTSETQIHSYNSEEHVTKYRHDKYVEDSYLEKKSKSEKKLENDVIKAKKEESFFSRLLLRKSGKKSKKDQIDGDGQQEVKKSKMEKSAHYKPVDAEKTPFSFDRGQGYKPVPAERTHKSAGQKVFANQMHKRLDNKGAYVKEGVYKDIYSAAKVAGIEYNITDLKVAEETDKMLNSEMKHRYSRREEFNERIERSKKTSSKEIIEENKKESFSLHHDKAKRPTSVQRLVDPFSTRAFINNEIALKEDNMSPSLMISEEESSVRAMRTKNVHGDYVFHSGSMPKNIPYFNPSLVVSASVSPPKSVLQSSENVKRLNRSSEHFSEFNEKQLVEKKREKSHRVTKTEESYVSSGLRSLGDEYVDSRSSIGKSQSFRYASETNSISSQESQMPSLPAIVGISEPLLESWEVNYRRNVGDRHDFSKRISARNYNVIPTNSEANYDSLQSTDSSYLDSLKNDAHEDRKLFTNNIHITVERKRDSDISQIEAKIDDIISSPKPILPTILKSSSLDSVKSSPEKHTEDRRKTISVESSLVHNDGVSNTYKKETKHNMENFVSVTHVNREQTPILTKNVESVQTYKSDEKIQKTGAKPGVPEFLKIQLNRVDTKPTTNVVLTANVTPKKLDSPQAEREQDIENFEVIETKPVHTVQVRRESIFNKLLESENTQKEEKFSPLVAKKIAQPITPQSPSTPKTFFKRKSISVEMQDRPEKPRTNSVSTDGSTEKIYDNISMDRKSHSSFGSKSSIQSSDSNELRTPDRHEETVVYRKKNVLSKELRGDKRNDDEPELMKVFARRSLKLKDSEVESLAQEIAESKKDDDTNATKTKILKNEFNASIKSRDSDKENDDSSKEHNEDKRFIDIAARVSQFGNYQRSVSINSVSNSKRESASAFKNDVSKYKKEVSDSTPEKRLRNRTFPDPSNDREDIKNIANKADISYKADTLAKRAWQNKDEDKRFSNENERRDSAVIERDGDIEKGESGKEKECVDSQTDASPQFKSIMQMKAEWEKRAKGMTK